MPTSPPTRCPATGCRHQSPCPDHAAKPWAGAKQRQANYPKHWPKLRAAVIRRDGRCVNCGSRAHLTADHRIPIHLGGTHDMSNLQALCEPCHRIKTAAEAVAARRSRRGRGLRDPSDTPTV